MTGFKMMKLAYENADCELKEKATKKLIVESLICFCVIGIFDIAVGIKILIG